LLFVAGDIIMTAKQEIPDMKSLALMRWMLLLLAVAAVPGCATHALWADADLGTWHEPSTNSTLRLFRSGQPWDLLVVYQESIEPHDARRMRAYLLHRNESRIEKQKRPMFVKIDSFRRLEPVPVFSATNAAAPSPKLPLYAIFSTSNVWFTLYSGGASVGSYSLPVYRDGRGRMERIAVTPLAAAADATIVGGAISAVVGLWYAEARGGASGLWPISLDDCRSFFEPNP
jgi:hypothetical protein